MSWYLQIGDAAPRTFSALQCASLRRQLRSQAPGVFSFRLGLQQIETGPLAAVDDVANVLWIDGATTPFFCGRVTRVPLAGSTAEEDQTYEISDAWMDFERITFQQQWNRITGVDESGNPTTAVQYSACCLLGVDLVGNPETSGQVIADVVNWAIARGALCQLGAIGVSAPVPVDEVTDLPCAEIIKRMLRYTPDAVAWFDFSTTPYPTFNVTRRADCGVVTMPFMGSGDHVAITPRNDLLRSQVLIRYEQPNVSDGVTSTTVIVDAAPGGADGLAFDALVSTVRLAGSNATFQKQPITVTPIPQSAADEGAVPFLQLNHAWLRQFSPDRLEVTSLSVAVDNPQVADDGAALGDFTVSDYPNQLLTGTISRWMQNAYPTLRCARVTVTAQVSYIYPEDPDDESAAAYAIFGPDDGSLDNWDNDTQVLTGIKGTNALQQTYAMMSDYTEAEAAPSGLAAVLYSALSILQYEGTWDVIQQEPAPATALGIVLNLSGGRLEWATMNALVQEIVDDLDKGNTTYKFGPSAQLTIQDLMEQLRATRTRTLSSKIRERQSGQPDADVVNGAGHTGGSSPSSPPSPTHYPWIDFIDVQDDPDSGHGETWEALMGYGKSTIAGDDAIDHSGPLEAFELSVGNDGSAWTGPQYDPDTLNNALSIISGDQDYTIDCIRIGAIDGGMGGSVLLRPGDPSISLSTHLDPADDAGNDPHIHFSLADLTMEMQDGVGNIVTIALATDSADASINLQGVAGAYILSQVLGGPSGEVASIEIFNQTGEVATLSGTQLIILDFNESSSNSCTINSDSIIIDDGASGGTSQLNGGELLFSNGANGALISPAGISAYQGSQGIYISVLDIAPNKTVGLFGLTIGGASYTLVGYPD